jgi:hypothetical protein
MPFTLSHAAAVLPFKRLSGARLPLAALMIGSMSPDFAYFLPDPPNRIATHNLVGLFVFCWPMALAAWLFYVHVLERPTRALMPERWRVRISPSDRRLSASALLAASIAVILGAATHIIWDSFTHARSPVVAALPVLHSVVATYRGHGIHLYWVLQHTSSVVGMTVLIAWAMRELRKSTAENSEPRDEPTAAVPVITNVARAGALASLFVTSIAIGLAYYEQHAGERFEYRLFHFAIGAMAGCVLAWCAIAVLVNRHLRASHRELRAE